MEKLFYAGKYSQILEKTIDSSSQQNWLVSKDLVWILGALCFKGREKEALRLLKSIKSPTEELLIWSRFFLGISLTRSSNFKKAKSLFQQNYKSLKFGLIPNSLAFLAHQGGAFFFFYLGLFEKAQGYADEALFSASQSQNLYANVLTKDLQSHIHIASGDIWKGLEGFKEVKNLAKKLGNGGLLAAIELSEMIYQSRYGYSFNQIIEKLQNALKEERFEDNYTQANILLELARQLMFRGRSYEAKDYLGKASRLAHIYENKKQQAQVALQLAHHSFLSGEYDQSLALLRSAKGAIHSKEDRLHYIRLLGLEIKILNKLDMIEELAFREREMEELIQKGGDSLARRIWNRKRINSSYQKELAGKGDLLGDLITNTKSSQDLIKKGFLGLLPSHLALNANKKYLLLGYIKDDLISIEGAEVQMHKRLSSLAQRLFVALGDGKEKSKEELVSFIWQYEYDPLRHDAILYALINSVRKNLKERSNWLETTENGYRFSQDLILLSKKEELREPSINEEQKLLFNTNLTFRQNKILHFLSQNEIIDIQSCKNKFSISEMTAYRDLSSLLKMGKVVRMGRGRATKYALNKGG